MACLELCSSLESWGLHRGFWVSVFLHSVTVLTVRRNVQANHYQGSPVIGLKKKPSLGWLGSGQGAGLNLVYMKKMLWI